ncbi:transposase [Natroniella acetigena]|uniref:transposase n=1 Tax=Natroniella acetigena TaxID=52004 RepID=UPI00200A86BC|nr:transposase [Natroniella acetigena]
MKILDSSTILFDRAYIKYQKFDEFIDNDIYFVTRAKSNTKIEIIRFLDLNSKDKEANVILDADIMLGDHTSKTRMKQEIKRVQQLWQIPFICVTHNRKEAEFLGDKILNIGRVS